MRIVAAALFFVGTCVAADGLRLSPEAEKTLGVSYLVLAGADRWTLPAESLVFSRDDVFVYRERGGALVAVPVAIVSRAGKTATIRATALRAGDRVVVKGAAAVRVAELDRNAGAEEARAVSSGEGT